MCAHVYVCTCVFTAMAYCACDTICVIGLHGERFTHQQHAQTSMLVHCSDIFILRFMASCPMSESGVLQMLCFSSCPFAQHGMHAYMAHMQPSETMFGAYQHMLAFKSNFLLCRHHTDYCCLHVEL